jgi:hypothetical protein
MIDMDKKRMQLKFGRPILFLSMVLSLLLPACFATDYGKFRVQDGVPQFIKMGQTTRNEVFDKLGEPLVHRFVAGRETAIYSADRFSFLLLYGSYEGRELVIRFENQTVSDARIEKSASGWSFLSTPEVICTHPMP